MSGWIKMHRKILENPVVCKDSDHIAVWTYLLLSATHKEYQAVFAGEKITLQPGQLITGRKSISEKFNISESKVQRILKSFEIEQQIEQQGSNKNRLVTVLSWDDYQSLEQQDELPVNNKRTTTEQQVNTNKNVKNLKNEKNVKEKVIKEMYALNVSLSKIEYEKLIEKYGSEEGVKWGIEKLSNYKFAKDPKYKSDYHVLIGWVHEEFEKKRLIVLEGGQSNASKPESRRQSPAAEYYANDAAGTNRSNLQSAAAGGGNARDSELDLDIFVRRG